MRKIKYSLSLFLLGLTCETAQAKSNFDVQKCGLSEVREQGEIEFGSDGYSQSAALKVEIDENSKNFYLKLSDVSLEQLNKIEDSELVQIKVSTPSEHKGNLNYWRRGQEFEVSELDSSRQLEFQLLVHLPRTRVPAGQYNINMTWNITCY